jgi:hypothetical protein
MEEGAARIYQLEPSEDAFSIPISSCLFNTTNKEAMMLGFTRTIKCAAAVFAAAAMLMVATLPSQADSG